MKNMRKIASLVLALVMVFAMATVAFADGTNGTITIENAAKGETYNAYKLFDATVVGDAITYQGSIPAGLESVFETNASGNVVVKAGVTDDAVIKAVQDYIAANKGTLTAEATGTGEGSAVVLTVPYGYYAVTTTQGTVISVDSTNPNATVYDKNSSEPHIDKLVEDDDLDIGATAKYTATATTSNYLGEGEAAEQVTQYEISDTLSHSFLSNVKITKITIGGEEYLVNGAVPQFDANGMITIPWVDANGNSLYANGAQIVINYEGIVTSGMVVGGSETTEDYTDGNVNTVTLQPYIDSDDNGEDERWDESWEDKEEIYTYAAALKKVDQTGAALAGAKFAVNGLTVEGSNGLYTVVSYDPTSTTAGTVMDTDGNGLLVIEGLNSGAELVVTETQAPAGYNKYDGEIKVKPIVTTVVVESSSGEVYYDADGNVISESETAASTKYVVNTIDEIKATTYTVVNQAGSELPSTGGMGTTLFYLVGGILVVAAVVLLVTKKRMATAE